jgi:hypothetical protein
MVRVLGDSALLGLVKLSVRSTVWKSRKLAEPVVGVNVSVYSVGFQLLLMPLSVDAASTSS